MINEHAASPLDFPNRISKEGEAMITESCVDSLKMLAPQWSTL
jgi:hypothetical protein